MTAKSRVRWARVIVGYALFTSILLAGAPFCKWANHLFYNTVAPYVGLAEENQPVYLLKQGEKQPYSPDVPVETKHLECPLIAKIDVRPEQVKECFASVEWSAQDFAALLKKTSECGIRNLAVSAPFIWEGGTQAAGQLLLCATMQNKKLFHNVVLGMRGRSTAQADLTPIQFRSYVIPTSQVKGDTNLLPAANRQIENDLDTAGSTTDLIWAPDWIEDEELTQVPAGLQERSFPLLVRWNGEILPTLPLRLALHVRECPIEKVEVELGKCIKLGALKLPIDSHGRITLTNVATHSLSLTGIIDGTEKIDITKNSSAVGVLMQPLSTKEPASRLELVAATLSQLCAVEVRETVIKPGDPLPSLWYRPIIASYTWRVITVLVLVFLLVRYVPAMPFFFRFVTMLSWLAWIAYTAWTHMQQALWFHAGLQLLVWALFVLLCPVLKPWRKRTLTLSRR